MRKPVVAEKMAEDFRRLCVALALPAEWQVRELERMYALESEEQNQ